MTSSGPGRATAGHSYLSWVAEPRVSHAEIVASSVGLGWKGAGLQVGINTGCDLDQVMIGGHYVGIQLNDDPIVVHCRDGGGWSEIHNPPKSLWIHPEGAPFSLRHRARSRWAGIVIQREFLDFVCGRPTELRAEYVVDDDLLRHLLCALVSQVIDDDPDTVHNAALSDSLLRSFILALGARHGAPLPANGGIAPYQLKALGDWLEANIAADLSVEKMAGLLGLSEAHFAREFKRSTGSTPWDYVIRTRTELACRLLQEGERPSAVAFRCGFSDQAHLSRVLKARRGVSPSKLRRRSSAPYA